MARKARVFIENTSQHVILKSLNGLTILRDKQDYKTFISILEKLSIKNSIKIHSYILMPQYFEFLNTPKNSDSLSKFMQNLGRNYVGYFNKKYNRNGTLWEGRYKSSLVEDDLYLLDVMKYIELQASVDHLFSSVKKNLFNKTDKIVSLHRVYKKLATTDKERVEKYSQHFYSATNDSKNDFIRRCLEKQLITGSVDFIRSVEEQTGLTLTPKDRGRPKKQTNKRNKMYKNLVVLDKEKHKSFKLNKLESISFAKETAFIPVVANEIGQIGVTFPIVFTSDENASLISLVSLGGESLAIDVSGKWITPYIPAYLRKYPFSLASTPNNPDQKVILIDEESSLFSKSKGKQLFKKNGEKSDILTKAVDFLTSYEHQMVTTKNVVKTIVDSGILENKEISVGEGDDKKILVQGFKVVNREKLNNLSDDILADWVRKGIINLIDIHLKSLDNVNRLFKILHQRQS